MSSVIATTDQTIKQLLRSPRLPMVARELQSILEAEQEKRQRFYDDMSESEKVEFINGEVVVHSPAKRRHNKAIGYLFSLLMAYVDKHHLGEVGQEKWLITLTRNDYEPDVCYWRWETAQHFTDDQMKFPAPDFVAEVLSPSTEDVDRGIKFEDYALHGVAEYWIVDPVAETIEQYTLHGERYELTVKVKTGVIQSGVVAGFEMPVRALFDVAEHSAALRAIVG